MGLQGQLNDVSDSIPLLLLALIAQCIGYIRSLLFTRRVEDEDSGWSLIEQLDRNGVCSHRFGADGEDLAGGSPDCIVCLSTVREGERVRKLGCRHVFHKDCFDGWLNQMRFSCPLCRSPLPSAVATWMTKLMALPLPLPLPPHDYQSLC